MNLELFVTRINCKYVEKWTKTIRYDKALKYFQIAIELCPSDQEFSNQLEQSLFNLGHTYRKLKFVFHLF